ncbi:hypothetical protein C8J56DRAFT_1050548 [Mycena floridula]|nr:hypothetical protein C8J56DRAFT_1050548 [Mycena floridula]
MKTSPEYAVFPPQIECLQVPPEIDRFFGVSYKSGTGIFPHPCIFTGLAPWASDIEGGMCFLAPFSDPFYDSSEVYDDLQAGCH